MFWSIHNNVLMEAVVNTMQDKMQPGLWPRKAIKSKENLITNDSDLLLLPQER